MYEPKCGHLSCRKVPLAIGSSYIKVGIFSWQSDKHLMVVNQDWREARSFKFTLCARW